MRRLRGWRFFRKQRIIEKALRQELTHSQFTSIVLLSGTQQEVFAMQKLSNEKALTFIDSFLTKIAVEKAAEESPINATSKDTGGEPAGTVPAKVEGTVNTAPDKTKDEEKAKEGTFGKEKSGDLDASPGTNVEDSGAENNVSRDNERVSTGDIGGGPVESAKIDTPSAVEAQKLKVAEELTMVNEFQRAQRLGNAILSKVAARLESTPKVEPQVAVEPQEEKTAEEQIMAKVAEEAYHDFVLSYQMGILKRAQDEAELQQALGISPEEASGMLDEIAMEDPEAVMPAEVVSADEIPEEAVAGGGDEEQLLAALAEAGVTPEELEAAIAEVETEDAAGAVDAVPEGMEVQAAEALLKRAGIGQWAGKAKEMAGQAGGKMKDLALFREMRNAEGLKGKAIGAGKSVGAIGAGVAGLGAAGYGGKKLLDKRKASKADKADEAEGGEKEASDRFEALKDLLRARR
jgi:hypothetical protein